MKLRQILLFLAIGVLGVWGSGAAEQDMEDSVDVKTYFPLGGKWTYDVKEFSNSWRAVRTISGPLKRPMGEVYLEKIVGQVGTQQNYYKVDNGLYLAGTTSPNWPDIEYDPPLVIFLNKFETGKTYQKGCVMKPAGWGAGYRVTMAREDEKIVVPAGSYSGCYRSERRSEMNLSDREVSWYAPGVGLVKKVYYGLGFTNSWLLVSYQGTNLLPGVRRLLEGEGK